MKKVILYNGEVFTVNAENQMAEAVVLSGNRILYVGSTVEAITFADEDTEKIDVGGRSILPGFIETHIHTTSRLIATRGFDVSKKAGITSIKDLQDCLRDAAKKADKGQWIYCHWLNFEDFKEHRWPTRYELDEVTPDNPVHIIHNSAHTSVNNTLALEAAHVLDGKIAYPEEHVLKGEDGLPNGVLKETAHFEFQEVVRKIDPVTSEILENTVAETGTLMTQCGITTCNDAGGTGETPIRAFQHLAETKRVNIRMNPMMFNLFGKDNNIRFANDVIHSGIYTGLGDEYYQVGPLKIMVDGSGASGTCATRKPMSHNGKIMPTSMTQEEIDSVIIPAHEAGFQCTAHAIGDRGVDMILNAYEKAQAAFPRKDVRHRIEHCMIAEPDLLERVKKAGVVPTFNPVFINVWGPSFNKYYQGQRRDYLIPIRSAIDMGITCTIASDWECHPYMSPISGVASAIDRTIYDTGEKVASDQAISLMEAIRCVTINAAYANHEEDILGSLEPGKLADLVVMDGKLTEMESRDIFHMDVKQTWFDGEKVYEKN